MHQLGHWLRQRSHRFSALLAVGLSVSLAIGACSTETAPTPAASPSATPATQAQVVRIGYQKFGTLNIVKARGGLEKRLQPLGVTVEWSLFPAGPQLLEGLNVESIDLGHTGEAPPIFAQAAGTPLVYVGNEPASPASEAILVPANSPIKAVADLKGKKVVLNKGSNVHYLLVRAIEDAGLQLSDVESIFLPPADARVAFEQGAADAWVIWDPFFAAAEQQIGAKVLRDGQGLVANREFYLGSRAFAAANPKIIEEVLAEIAAVDDWAEANPDKVAEILSPQLNIDVPTLKTVVQRRDYGVEPISDAVLADQQKIADTFTKLQLIPKSIDVKEATL
ncbi:MAG: sulfonate ABC transporter substrate-binding protein [Leptolyngbyaceae cyanobacterium SL_7_1]|nr:sulfonate ABC transporter substrate-binding protein [Leptolyngbyaceae cyanobacterium SL_7_1]